MSLGEYIVFIHLNITVTKNYLYFSLVFWLLCRSIHQGMKSHIPYLVTVNHHSKLHSQMKTSAERPKRWTKIKYFLVVNNSQIYVYIYIYIYDIGIFIVS